MKNQHISVFFLHDLRFVVNCKPLKKLSLQLIYTCAVKCQHKNLQS